MVTIEYRYNWQTEALDCFCPELSGKFTARNLREIKDRARGIDGHPPFQIVDLDDRRRILWQNCPGKVRQGYQVMDLDDRRNIPAPEPVQQAAPRSSVRKIHFDEDLVRRFSEEELTLLVLAVEDGIPDGGRLALA